MLIETLAIEKLRPAPYNPRITLKPGDAAWKKLERSLREFDLVQPIVWNSRTGHVVGGHQRLEVLRHHGRQEIECVVVDLSLEKEQALNVALNNASVGSDWDADKLVDLLTDLKSLPDFDETLTGFDDAQLQDLLLSPAVEGPPGEVEEENRDEVTVTMEVPREAWPDAERHLDVLLGELPEVRLHVRGGAG